VPLFPRDSVLKQVEKDKAPKKKLAIVSNEDGRNIMFRTPLSKNPEEF